MSSISPSLRLFVSLAKAQAVVSRRFDAHLGSHHGLGFSDFVILLNLDTAAGKRMRRGDLAEAVGLTASGVTRLLAPMEKIGLIKREATEHDARVSYVAIAPGGKRLLDEALETAEETSVDLLEGEKMKRIGEVTDLLEALPHRGPAYR